MNRLELNRMEELINRLLDRGVSSSEKSVLLDELSKYPEYKSELAEYEEIQSAIQKDKILQMPPEDYNKAVFAQVDKLSETIFGKSFFVKNKYALLGLLILLVSFTGYFGKDLFKNDKNSNDLTAKKEIVASKSTINNDVQNQNSNTNINPIPVTSNTEKSSNVKKVRTSVKSSNANELIVSSKEPGKTHKTKEISGKEKETIKVVGNKLSHEVKEVLALNKTDQIEPLEFDDSKRIISEEKQFLDPRFNSVVVNSSFDKFSQNQVIPLSLGQNKYSRALLQNLSKTNWLLQYRGLYAVSNPEQSLQGRNFYFNSYCFGGFVEAFQGVYLGAEFGAEPYSQIYLDPNTSVQFEQTPNIFYFGVAGKFALQDAKFLGIYPAAQLFAGSSSLGPLFRTNLTLQYDMFGKVGLFFGTEGGVVFYSNNNVWYKSGKLGLIGGLNIKL